MAQAMQPRRRATPPPVVRRLPPDRRPGTTLIPLSGSRREALQTNLWAVPSLMIGLIVVLFAVTYGIDAQAAAGSLVLPA